MGPVYLRSRLDLGSKLLVFVAKALRHLGMVFVFLGLDLCGTVTGRRSLDGTSGSLAARGAKAIPCSLRRQQAAMPLQVLRVSNVVHAAACLICCPVSCCSHNPMLHSDNVACAQCASLPPHAGLQYRTCIFSGFYMLEFWQSWVAQLEYTTCGTPSMGGGPTLFCNFPSG